MSSSSAAHAEETMGGETAHRTARVAARLKELYKKHVLPVEKRYQYDYFFESPLLSDVEFDGTCMMKHDCKKSCSVGSPIESSECSRPVFTHSPIFLRITVCCTVQPNHKFFSLVNTVLARRPSFVTSSAVTFRVNASVQNQPPIALLFYSMARKIAPSLVMPCRFILNCRFGD